VTGWGGINVEEEDLVALSEEQLTKTRQKIINTKIFFNILS
jgi:hypothetical protein